MNTTSVFDQLTAIQSWPAVGLAFALCIIIGYCFKLWPTFPNAAIPAIVVASGAIWTVLLGDAIPASVGPRLWYARQVAVGFVIGFAAWMAHNLILSRLENWLSSIFPSVGTFLNKPPGPPPAAPAWLFLPLAASLLVGCQTLVPGADPFVVNVERIQKVAGSSADLVLHVDQADRGFWRTNAPAFHQFCEWLRTPVPYPGTNAARIIVIQLNVDDLKLTYKTTRNSANSNALAVAVAELDQIALQAGSWSAIVTNRIHP